MKGNIVIAFYFENPISMIKFKNYIYLIALFRFGPIHTTYV